MGPILQNFSPHRWHMGHLIHGALNLMLIRYHTIYWSAVTQSIDVILLL